MTANEVALLAEHATFFSSLEGARARADTPELRGTLEAAADALRVVSFFMRGQLPRAAALAKTCDYFRKYADLPHAYATAYGAWATALTGDVVAAARVLREWELSPRPKAPRARQFVLRARGWVSGLAGDTQDEILRVSEAMALCDRHGLHVERAFAQVELGFAHLRDDDLAHARALSGALPEPHAGEPRAHALLEAYRDLLRLEVALHEGDADAARRAATRAAAYYEETGNAVLACDALFGACVASAFSARAEGMLRSYRRAVQRSPTALHQQRLRTLSALGPLLFRRGARLVCTAVASGAREPAELVHLFRPPFEWRNADLYLDEPRKEVWLSGHGPFALGEHPVVEAVLLALLASPTGLPVAALFDRVWGGEYHPLRHENKVHVTLHRLRQWLACRHPDAAALVILAEGRVRVSEVADVRVLSLRAR